jgi:CRP-like cAMP-binding protein
MNYDSQLGRVVENKILLRLPADEYDSILPKLEVVDLRYGKVLYNPGDAIKHVFFPNGGMCSLLATTEDGSTVEVGMVGNEGVVGVPVILGANSMPYQVTVQVQGTALRMKGSLLREAFNQRGLFHDQILLYVYDLLAQISQSASCNRFHTVRQRLCRWLLTTCDRAKSNLFRLTQEVLSHMLGARRQGVNEAAGDIKQLGLISHDRGQITVLDREGLEAFSCECYRIIKEL